MDNLTKQTVQRPTPEPEPPSAAASANTNTAPKAANSNSAPTLAPYKKSAGDKLFDLGVYGGLGYIANAGISLAVTRYGTHVKSAKLYQLGKKTEQGFASFYKPLIKDAESVDYWAKKSNEIAFLGFGGWALLLPMKWLEDRKSTIIRATDNALGTGPQSEEGIQQQQAALSSGPRQSMASLFGGRVISYAATIAFALPFITRWTKTNERFSLLLDKHLTHRITPEWRTPVNTINGKQVPAIIDSFGSEIILAGTASVLHYGSSKLLAHAGHQVSNAPPQLPKGFLASTLPANTPQPPQAKVEAASHEGMTDTAHERIHALPQS